MKKLILITLVAFLSACSSKVDNPGNDEEILRQISEYKSQVNELNKKISELEKMLSSNNSNEGVSVTVREMKPEPFNHYIEVTGTAEAISSAFISPEINGQVREIYVTEGQSVNKGQLLIRINSSITETTIDEVKTSLELARVVFEKQKQLWDKNIGSEIDYLQAKNNVETLESRLETLYAQLDMAEIKSPINGIVDDILIKKGELAIPGMEIVRLVNLDEIYINADISEAYITNVKVGEKVLLEFPSFPDYSMEVPVYRTGNIIKEANRTFKLQLKIKNRDGMIKPNILAKIKINDFSMEEALLVPSIIIKQDMQGKYMYTVDAATQTAKKVYVETGRSYLDMTVISGGIETGDRVIVEGYNQVSTGSKVKFSS